LVDGAVRLELDDGTEVAIPRDQVAKVRLEIEIDGFRPRAGTRGRDA
jgi:hypothetical protein